MDNVRINNAINTVDITIILKVFVPFIFKLYTNVKDLLEAKKSYI